MLPGSRRKREEPARGNWLLTYGCLMTQLLIFFVMLFALSLQTTEHQLRQIKKRVDDYVERNNLRDRIRTDLSQKEKGLVISLGDTLMFESGKAELANAEAREHIRSIAELIQNDPDGHAYPNRVAIEGHTDNVPVRAGSEFESNWELSTARATNITRFLVEGMNFEPQRISSSGYAEWWPAQETLRDLSEAERQRMPPAELVRHANGTPDLRARNRRVDIVVRRLELWELQHWREELMRAVSKTVGKK
jgi:flagellar motor protein MotB